MKQILIVLGAIVLLGGAFFYFTRPVAPPVTPVEQTPPETPAPQVEPPAPPAQSPPPSSTPPAGNQQGEVPPAAGPKTFTRAEVATHNTPADCYTIINGKVYNLTSWISQHPGGQSPIKGLCGIDGTAPFTAQHDGNKKQQDILVGFLVGVLAP